MFFSNFEGGEWDSRLLEQMKVVVRPYMYPLWLDRPYHYHLTYGHELDFDHYIDIASVAPGSSEETIVRLPDDTLGVGPRRERYESLAWHFARRSRLCQRLMSYCHWRLARECSSKTRPARQVRCFRKRAAVFGRRARRHRARTRRMNDFMPPMCSFSQATTSPS